MALEPVPDPQDEQGDGQSLVLPGSEQLSFSIGGKKPTSSKLTLTGGQIEVEGQFKKGEIVVFQVEAVVEEVAFRDQVDSKTRQVVGCTRKQKARIVGSQLVESHPPADLSPAAGGDD